MGYLAFYLKNLSDEELKEYNVKNIWELSEDEIESLMTEFKDVL